MCRQVQWLLATVAAGVFLGPGQAAATTMTSSSYSAWTAGLTGTPTELNFSPIMTGTGYNSSNGITLKAIGNSSIGFTFTGPDNGAYKLTGYAYGPNNYQSLESGSDATATMSIATPQAVDNALFVAIATTKNRPGLPTLSDG